MSKVTGKKTIGSLSKKSLFLTQLSLLMVVVLFLADKSMVFNWIRNFINMTHSAELEYIFTQLLLPSRAIYELSQAISFLYLLKALVVVSIVTMLLLLFVVSIVYRAKDNRKEHPVKISEVTEDNQFTYKLQEKFLC